MGELASRSARLGFFGRREEGIIGDQSRGTARSVFTNFAKFG